MTQPPSKAPRKGLITALEGGLALAPSTAVSARRTGIAFRYVAGIAENHADINGLARVSGEKGLAREQSIEGGDALGQRFRKWCLEAGLKNHGAHGVRKATGLFTFLGCAQYEIMSIHGHTEAGTSEIYTKGVERWNVALSAMDKLRTMDW